MGVCLSSHRLMLSLLLWWQSHYRAFSKQHLLFKKFKLKKKIASKVLDTIMAFGNKVCSSLKYTFTIIILFDVLMLRCDHPKARRTLTSE